MTESIALDAGGKILQTRQWKRFKIAQGVLYRRIYLEWVHGIGDDEWCMRAIPCRPFLMAVPSSWFKTSVTEHGGDYIVVPTKRVPPTAMKGRISIRSVSAAGIVYTLDIQAGPERGVFDGLD